jgi:hypothetical protein
MVGDVLVPKAGERIGGRYLLVERLGAGGMGEVWLAVLEGAGTFRRKVVVKFVPAEKAGDDRLIAMLADEARVLGLLFHPGIVAPVDYVEGPEGPVLVLEYVDGPSLRTALRQAWRSRLLLPEALAAWVGAEVARALHAAHEATDEAGLPLKLIHRDVSPDNVLLTRDGRVKLADFGVARASGNSEVTVPGAAPKGKRGYMPPEQAAGRALGPSADIFALGRLVAEAADVGCSHELRAVLDKATAPEPLDRYQTGAEFAAALSEVCPPPPDPSGLLAEWLGTACADLFTPAGTSPGGTASPSQPPRAKGSKTFHLRFQTDPGLQPRSDPGLRKSEGPGTRPVSNPGLPPRELFASVAPPPLPRSLRFVAGALILVAVGLPLALFAESSGLHLPDASALQGLQAPRGMLVVMSSPEGGEVYVDGQLRGNAPVRLQLAVGKHSLRVGSLRLERWRAADVVVKEAVTERVQVDLTE